MSLNEVTTTKIVRQNGTSLTINITRELRTMGIDRGDAIEVTIKRIKNGMHASI